jgi:nonsense-mediated mRNA decay protein 3
MPKHCPICNRSSADTKFFGEFCSYCVESKMQKKLPDEVELTVCHRCGMIKSKGGYMEHTSEALEDALSQVIKGYRIRLMSADEDSVTLKITEDLPEYSVTVNKKIHIKWKKQMCERCNRISGGYYEAVIQLRGSDSEKMERFVNRVTRYFEKRNEFITKVKEADNGLDIYLSNKKLAAAYLSSHDVEFVPSYTLYGLKQGKKVYRHTYAVRI